MSHCSDGWRITGYYTPEESQFDGASEKIRLPDGTTETFLNDFLRHTKVDRWAAPGSAGSSPVLEARGRGFR